jgi:ribosomal-protein-alanine N-acetyltransferase
MRQIEQWSQDRGASAMMLEVEHSNESAIELYKALGYMKISVRMDYYGLGKDAFVMRKDFA